MSRNSTSTPAPSEWNGQIPKGFQSPACPVCGARAWRAAPAPVFKARKLVRAGAYSCARQGHAAPASLFPILEILAFKAMVLSADEAAAVPVPDPLAPAPDASDEDPYEGGAGRRDEADKANLPPELRAILSAPAPKVRTADGAGYYFEHEVIDYKETYHHICEITREQVELLADFSQSCAEGEMPGFYEHDQPGFDPDRALAADLLLTRLISVGSGTISADLRPSELARAYQDKRAIGLFERY